MAISGACAARPAAATGRTGGGAFPRHPRPPPCGGGGWRPPGVFGLGEPLPEGMMQKAEHATLAAQVVLVVGTSAQVYPAAGLIPLAKQAGARVIQVNLEPTPYSGIADCALEGPAGELLPQWH